MVIAVYVVIKSKTKCKGNVPYIMCTNFHSLDNKLCELMAFISWDNLDLVVQERGGGADIYVKNCLNSTVIQKAHKELETIWVCMQTTEGSVIRNGWIYRPPGETEDYHNLLVDEITQMSKKGDRAVKTSTCFMLIEIFLVPLHARAGI